MGKQKAPRRVGDNEALAVGTTIRGSAQKLNLVFWLSVVMFPLAIVCMGMVTWWKRR